MSLKDRPVHSGYPDMELAVYNPTTVIKSGDVLINGESFQKPYDRTETPWEIVHQTATRMKLVGKSPIEGYTHRYKVYTNEGKECIVDVIA